MFIPKKKEKIKQFISFFLFSAFSTFAFAEYFVATANMGYYWTLVSDLPNEEIVVKQPFLTAATNSNVANGHHPLEKKEQ